MADNVGYTPGSGASIAADDVGGVLHQRVKLTLGVDGATEGDVSSSNPMPVGSGVVDATNSSTTTLSAGGQFTGAAFDGQRYVAVALLLYSDTPSIKDGVQVQFSSDGANWDETVSFTYDPKDGTLALQLALRGRYARVVYSNGGAAQNSFRLQTLFRSVPEIGAVTAMDDVATIGLTVQATGAVLVARRTDALGYVRVQANADGELQAQVEGMQTVQELLSRMLLEMRLQSFILQSGFVGQLMDLKGLDLTRLRESGEFDPDTIH